MNRQMTKVVLARHGETTFNRNRVIMGRTDSELTSEGILVATHVAEFIAKEAVDTVFSSPLGRALATARIYVETTRLTIVPQEAMAELACGAWEGRAKLEVKPDPYLIRDTWDDRPPGGESYRDAEDRVRAFIHAMQNEISANHVLIVGHAGVNRVFLRLWLGLQPEDAIRILCPHDTIFILNGQGQVYAHSLSRGMIKGLPTLSETIGIRNP